jgi:cation diffusion facilitator CzcD-associated flavoprotein CzcO
MQADGGDVVECDVVTRGASFSDAGLMQAYDGDVVECDVVTIGAGFVGLAVGAALACHGDSHGRCRIIEQGPCCGAFWHGGHEHLSLHSPYHRLPHDGGLAMKYPMFKTKAEVRDYLETYAAQHCLDDCISFGEKVLNVKHCSHPTHPLCVRTDKALYRCKRLVVATGLNRRPHIPDFEGLELHPDVCHSWEVETCARYKGKRVIIIGSGNSSAELAVALHEAGAASIDLLVDAPRHFVRRSTMGRVFRLFPYLGLSTESMVHELHRCTFGPGSGA